jgi:hypothetical protein
LYYRKNGTAVLWRMPQKCYTLFYMRRTLTALRVEQTQLDKLAKIGQKEDRSVSYLIRQAIEEFLKRRETRRKEGRQQVGGK